jgi:hypothetical protein
MENISRQKAIRVTLSFGDNSDSALVRALREQRPYARAKLLRKLIREGLRSRLRSLGHGDVASTPRPDLTSEVLKRQRVQSPIEESGHISVPTEQQAGHDDFSESVLDQLGKTVQ